MPIDELKRFFKKIAGNKKVPEPVPVPEMEEYEEISITPDTEKSESLLLKRKEEEKKEEEVKVEVKEVIKEVKIYPKMYIVRIKHPKDFDEIKRFLDNYDIIILNLEEAPMEAISKNIKDFIDYASILGFKLGLITETVMLAFKNEVEIDKYVSNIKEDAERVE